MPWRDAQELWIFAPTEQSSENWVEQILGTIVRPLHDNFRDSIRWLWVTRYVETTAELPPQYREHFSKRSLTDRLLFKFSDEVCCYRYVRFRLSVEATKREELQATALNLAQAAGFYVMHWEDYIVVADLGSDRFIHDKADDEKRPERAKLVVEFIDVTVRLMLHALNEEDGQWKLESNADNKQNPDGSFFQSLHHLFCNATDVPTFVVNRFRVKF